MDNQANDLKLENGYRKRGKKKVTKESQKMEEKRKQLVKKTGSEYSM